MKRATTSPRRREHSLHQPPKRTSVADLRLVGRELDCTHRELATLLGISLASLEHWLSGRTPVPLPMTLALRALTHRDLHRRAMAKRRKRQKQLAESLRLRPPVKHLFY